MHSLAQMLDPAHWAALLTSGWNDLGEAEFWVAVAKIIWINILLSGDNAVVIAMACRGLPHRQRIWGMILGAGVAVVLRIVFTGVVASLMLLPYLKIAGGLALFYIAAKLLVPDDPDESETEAVEHLWRAVRIVAVADIIMSLDNVIAIAAAAGGNMALLVLGLAISIPLIVAGAALDHGAARPLPDPGLGGRRAARLDRRRGDRDRSRGDGLSDPRLWRCDCAHRGVRRRGGRRCAGADRRRVVAAGEARKRSVSARLPTSTITAILPAR